MKLNIVQQRFINDKLNKLKDSKFRSSFNLTKKDLEYLKSRSIEEIEEHAYKFINDRLKPKVILNDGKQTPMRGHPVFKAQHATATCCRGCLEKWHKIKKDKELSDKEIRFIVALIIEWILRNKDGSEYENENKRIV